MKLLTTLTAGLFCGIVLWGCSRGTKEVVPSSPLKVAVKEVPPVLFVAEKQSLPLQENARMRALVLAQMPRGGFSEFFGTCKGRFRTASVLKAGDLAAHFYALPAQRDKAKLKGANKFSLFLDLFSMNVAKKSVSLRRLNRIDLTSMQCLTGNWAHGEDSVNAVDLMWLDSRHQIPMLKFRMSGTVMSGVAGCFGLAVFPQGLQANPFRQDFETYDQMMGKMSVFFSDRNKRGFLVVRQEIRSYHMDFDKQQTTEKLESRTYFDWNGQGFVAPKSKTAPESN